jgi:bifunctional enzyme CysN/CysC
MLCRPQNRPLVERDLDAMVCWMAEAPMQPGGRYLVKHTTRAVRGTVADLRYRIDVNSLHRDQEAAALELNDIGRVTLRLSEPLAFDTYTRNRGTGAFILVDPNTNDTVGAGLIIGASSPAAADAPRVLRSPNVTWHGGQVGRMGRWNLLEQQGAVVWMTGLPASGKSSIAHAVEESLLQAGRSAYVLDGDNLRHGLNGDLGFSDEDRAENVRRTAHVARLMADAGTVAIVSLVSPFAADRDQARELVEAEGLQFLEVWVSTPVEECERRDPKGLYAKARAGEISGFTGVDGPYEPPVQPEVELGGGLDVQAAAKRLLDALTDAGQ